MIVLTMTPHLRAICAHAETLEIDVPSHEEFQALKADLVAAHAHIELLHKLMNDAYQALPFCNAFKEHRAPLCEAWAVVMNWEDSQCL